MQLEEFIAIRRLGSLPKIKDFRDKKIIPLLSDLIQEELSSQKNKLSKLKTYFDLTKEDACISIYRGEYGKFKGVEAYARLAFLDFSIIKLKEPDRERLWYRGLTCSLILSEKNAPKLKRKLEDFIDKIMTSTLPDKWHDHFDKKDF